MSTFNISVVMAVLASAVTVSMYSRLRFQRVARFHLPLSIRMVMLPQEKGDLI